MAHFYLKLMWELNYHVLKEILFEIFFKTSRVHYVSIWIIHHFKRYCFWFKIFLWTLFPITNFNYSKLLIVTLNCNSIFFSKNCSFTIFNFSLKIIDIKFIVSLIRVDVLQVEWKITSYNLSFSLKVVSLILCIKITQYK